MRDATLGGKVGGGSEREGKGGGNCVSERGRGRGRERKRDADVCSCSPLLFETERRACVRMLSSKALF